MIKDKIEELAKPVPIMGPRMAGRARILAELPHLQGFALVRKQCVEFEGRLIDFQSAFIPTSNRLYELGWEGVYRLPDGRGLLVKELAGNMAQLAIITRGGAK